MPELASFEPLPHQNVRPRLDTVSREATSIAQHPQRQRPVALVSKVVRDVACKEYFKDWQIARCGETLSSGDRIRTGKNSIAIIRFNDNSLVRVRDCSELILTGSRTRSSFSKSVDLDEGAVGFKIIKQRSDEAFRFTSPTSVASIRGTKGLFVAHHLSDTLTVIEGTVLLTNVLSQKSVEVRGGFTGISDPDGTITMRMATPDELTSAGRAVQEDRETLQVVSRGGANDGREIHRSYSTKRDRPDSFIRGAFGKTLRNAPIITEELTIVARKFILPIHSGYGAGFP